jgi:hypothetical protein
MPRQSIKFEYPLLTFTVIYKGEQHTVNTTSVKPTLVSLTKDVVDTLGLSGWVSLFHQRGSEKGVGIGDLRYDDGKIGRRISPSPSLYLQGIKNGDTLEVTVDD